VKNEHEEAAYRNELIEREAMALMKREFLDTDAETAAAIYRVWKRFLSWDEDEIARLRMIVSVLDLGYQRAMLHDDEVTPEEYRELLRNL